MAVVAAPPGESLAEMALGAGLIWLNARARNGEGHLVLFLHQDECWEVAQRVQLLDGQAGCRVEVCAFDDHHVWPMDPNDFGNVRSKVDPFLSWRRRAPSAVLGAADHLEGIDGIEFVGLQGGALSIRIRGKEFARMSNGTMRFGLDHRVPYRPGLLDSLYSLGGHLAAMRRPGEIGVLARSEPERWLEYSVRRHLDVIDPWLTPGLVHGQIPAILATGRSVIDLLALDRTGRLTVIELKASTDPLLPLQALDYWARVQWHLERGDFEGKGYFNGAPIRKEPPRLLLVAPALEFHPTSESLLRHFPRQIEVERVGLGVEWQERPRVVFRLRQSERPDERMTRSGEVMDVPSIAPASAFGAEQPQPF
jgi:hypothetical protein